jgi:hypothetical protein
MELENPGRHKQQWPILISGPTLSIAAQELGAMRLGISRIEKVW